MFEFIITFMIFALAIVAIVAIVFNKDNLAGHLIDVLRQITGAVIGGKHEKKKPSNKGTNTPPSCSNF